MWNSLSQTLLKITSPAYPIFTRGRSSGILALSIPIIAVQWILPARDDAR